MNRDELHERLRAAADAPAPGADPAFAAALEQRLRAVHHSLPDDLPGRIPGATEPRPDAATPAPGRPWFRSPVSVTAALAVLALLAVPLLLRPPGDPALALVAAYDTQVRMPDGRRVTARPGLVLEEGAVVLTGPRGSAEAGGLVLGSGEVAVVEDGRLRRVERTAARPTAKPSPTDRPSGPAAPASPLGALPVLPGQSPRPSRPDAQASTRPAERPATQDEAAATPSPGEETAQTGKAAPDDRHPIGLATWADKRVVQLAWTEFAHPDFAFFAVLRAPYPAVPQWPLANGTEVVGHSPDAAQRQYTDDDVDYRPVYRIVALDRYGNELGRSGAVTPPFEQTPSRPEAREAGPITYTD
jgi:hypothetical protein